MGGWDCLSAPACWPGPYRTSVHLWAALPYRALRTFGRFGFAFPLIPNMWGGPRMLVIVSSHRVGGDGCGCGLLVVLYVCSLLLRYPLTRHRHQPHDLHDDT